VERRLVVPLHTYVCEILGFLGMLYGSIRYRSPIL